MPKNVVIFADGTGQGGAISGAVPTNVYKLFQVCPTIPGVQETFYERGVGSPLHRDRLHLWRRLYNVVSSATGLGISRNIADCYDALISMYEPGDRIYLFGFSRGAYTVRCLGGVLSLCGIPRYSPRGLDLRNNKRARKRAVQHAIRRVYQTYGRSEVKKRRRHARANHFRDQHQSHSEEVYPYFIGVWDTVRALGLPGVSRFVFWRHTFHDCALDPRVPYARQALSIDENRSIFFPELWDELEIDRSGGRVKQVWFPGVHSDIGGGYPDSELGDLTLEWMIEEATAIPLPLLVDRSRLSLRPSHRGMQHDARMGLGFLWVKGTREGLQHKALAIEANVVKRVGENKVPTVHGEMPYRPGLLSGHPEFLKYYRAIAARRRGFFQRLSSVIIPKT